MRLPRGRLPERIGTFGGFVADAPIQVFRLCAFPRRNDLGPPDGSRDYFQAIDQRHDPWATAGAPAIPPMARIFRRSRAAARGKMTRRCWSSAARERGLLGCEHWAWGAGHSNRI